MTPSSLDLDANATTPLDPRVLEAMRPHLLAGGNAESRHALGRAARRAWEQARQDVAQFLGADFDEVLFTSGGTEANNLALLGLLGSDTATAHAVASPIEHPAVTAPLQLSVKRGLTLELSVVGSDGIVAVGDFAARFRPETRLAVLMLANNETGAIQPVADLAKHAAERGIAVHTDAAQAIGRIPIDFRSLGAATLAVGAHKMHGPPGLGALLVRRGIKLDPMLHGGGQQQGLRPGTPPVPLAVGMAEALRLWHAEAGDRTARWRALRDHLERRLVNMLGYENVIRHGPIDEPRRLPQTLCIGFPGVDPNVLLMQLDLAGVCVSLGSACASGTTQPSPVLVAMKVRDDLVKTSLRFSLNAFTTQYDIDEAVLRVTAAVERSRL